ncbi:MAG: flagella basal body P-ring formation protein FlgA [Bdellovibrionales bacterium]|nr:flagella basal body P-ring formation protein FlgA [Bdellovibrionales bacterium]
MIQIRKNFEPFYLTLIVAVLAALGSGASASGSSMDEVKKALETIHPEAKIILGEDREKIRGETLGSVRRVKFLNEIRPGRVRYTIEDSTGNEAEYEAGYKAMISAWIAVRRILPAKKIVETDFRKGEIDVAQGINRELKGLAISPDTRLESLESRQTIMEGSFLISSAVQRVADLKKGDPVKIKMIAGDLILQTSGQATEPAYLNETAKVITSKGKKDLVGTLRKNGEVEVRL